MKSRESKKKKLALTSFSRFSRKILPCDFLGLILNKSFCNSHCKPFTEENFVLEIWPKILSANHLEGFLKL